LVAILSISLRRLISLKISSTNQWSRPVVSARRYQQLFLASRCRFRFVVKLPEGIFGALPVATGNCMPPRGLLGKQIVLRWFSTAGAHIDSNHTDTVNDNTGRCIAARDSNLSETQLFQSYWAAVFNVFKSFGQWSQKISAQVHSAVPNSAPLQKISKWRNS
jgi:hypothetical protein